MLKKLILATFFFLSASCAVKYTPPTSGETATLVLPLTKSSQTFFGGVATSGVAFAVKDNDGCGQLSQELMPEGEEVTRIEVTIPANKDIFVQFSTYRGTMNCNVLGWFPVLPNRKYTILKIGSASRCNIGVTQELPDVGPQLVALQKARYTGLTGVKVCEVKNTL
ncbi:MAG: hypothetical protein AAGB12_10180 [Pseudomonadota bacterium]